MGRWNKQQTKLTNKQANKQTKQIATDTITTSKTLAFAQTHPELSKKGHSRHEKPCLLPKRVFT
jgi:hypothetical protein